VGEGGFFVMSFGNVTDEVITEYIRTQEVTRKTTISRWTRVKQALHSRAFSQLANPPASGRWWLSSPSCTIISRTGRAKHAGRRRQ
jgi:hypothetical protein